MRDADLHFVLGYARAGGPARACRRSRLVVVVGNRFIPSREMNEIVRPYEHADTPRRIVLSAPGIGARSSAIMRRVTRCALRARGNGRRLTHPVSRIYGAQRLSVECRDIVRY